MALRGRHPHNRLTDLMVRQAKPGRHSDGGGLHAYVRPNGHRGWVHRITINGIRCDLGLGPYPDVGVAEARDLAEENRRVVRSGGDPRRERKTVPTLREMVESVIETRRPNWKTDGAEQGFRHLFDKYVFEKLGDRPIDQVELQEILGILTPIWKGRRSQGYVLRQHLSSVMRTAIAHGYRSDDLAVRAKELLPKVTVAPVHHASLPYRQAPEALSSVLASAAADRVKLFVVFTVLTAARYGEAADAVWSEMTDIEGHRGWLVPSERMKGGTEHRVPLSRQAQEVLSAARRLVPGSRYVFRVGARPFPRREVTALLRSLNLVDEQRRPATMHGFRATCRVWAMDSKTTFECCEAVLAHHQTNQTVAAYARSDLFELRVPLMQQWADFLLPQGLLTS